MLGFFDPLCKFIGGYVYETSFGKHPPNSFFLGLLMWSAHGAILRSRRANWGSNLGSTRHSGSGGLNPACLNLRYVYARYWFSSAQKDCS
jgi:hypothetical protein